MKSSKHIDLKDHKVLLGLFSLLFIGSMVQTGAILKFSQSNQQVSQVLLSGSTKYCVSATHLYNQSEFFHIGPEGSQPGDYYRFRGNYRLKNNCNFGVKILDTNQTSQDITKVQGLSWNGSPADLSLTDTTVFPNSQWAPSESLDCLNCFLPSDSAQSYTASFSPLSPTVNAFSLAPGQERDYIITRYVSVYDSNDFSNLYQNYIRVMVTGIKYFKDSALSDGVVSANEITTSQFTSAERERYVGDYVKFIHSGEYSGIKETTKGDVIETKTNVR
ncbi:MAG: hypothetical protein R3B65_02335 [Candidatus Paceibacterota bacterium]